MITFKIIYIFGMCFTGGGISFLLFQHKQQFDMIAVFGAILGTLCWPITLGVFMASITDSLERISNVKIQGNKGVDC